MPVNVLLCEGEESSFDVLVLRAILQGLPLEVRASGGKYGLGERVKARRESMGAVNVYAIRDRDYDLRPEWKADDSAILPWKAEGERLHLGWYWRRIDIESYLVAPEVVSIAFPDAVWLENYRVAFDNAIHDLTPYVACRASLGESRKRFNPIPNKFGRKVNAFSDHLFPEKLDGAWLDTKLRDVVDSYNHEAIVDPEQVAKLKAERLSDLSVKSLNARSEEWVSGKDIALRVKRDIEAFGFQGARPFLDRVAKALKNSPSDVWTVLPEWISLRKAIEGVK